MKELPIPVYYVVSRNVSPETVGDIMHCLAITPVACSIITNVLDAQLALSLCDTLLMANSFETATLIASRIHDDTGMPSVVVGEADFIDAVYADGTREALATTC